MIKEYILKNKDEVVLEFEVHRKEKTFESGKAFVEELENIVFKDTFLPFGIKKEDLSESLKTWIKNRKIPKNRAFVNELVASYQNENGETLMDYVNVSLALSLNDSFWIVPKDKAYKWKDYNLYTNDFNEALALVAFGIKTERIEGITSSPEFTTNGMLRKCWHKDESGIYLYKSSANVKDESYGGKEAYAEYYMAQIASLMNFTHISYDLKEFHNQIISSCPIFTNENEGFVPIYFYLDNKKLKGLDLVKELEKTYDEDKLQDLLVFDALIANKDRHLGNFGMIVDNNTGKLLRVAPIFDNGYSMMNLLYKEDLSHIDTALNSTMSYLEFSFDTQLKLFIQPRHAENLEKLKHFTFKRHAKYNLSEEWLKPIESFIQQRATKALEFIKEKEALEEQTKIHQAEADLRAKEQRSDILETSSSESLKEITNAHANRVRKR